MKKIAMLWVMCFLVFYGCDQKSQPKPLPQMPSGPVQGGPIQSMDEERLLRDVVAKDPKNTGAWIKLGNILMDSSRYKEAAEAYQKALDLDPRNVDVRVDMGTCLRYAGRPDLAIKEYQKALQINPNHLNANRNLGVVLANDIKDNQGAIKAFEKAISLVPNSPDALRMKEEVARLKSGR